MALSMMSPNFAALFASFLMVLQVYPDLMAYTVINKDTTDVTTTIGMISCIGIGPSSVSPSRLIWLKVFNVRATCLQGKMGKFLY